MSLLRRINFNYVLEKLTIKEIGNILKLYSEKKKQMFSCLELTLKRKQKSGQDIIRQRISHTYLTYKDFFNVFCFTRAIVYTKLTTDKPLRRI